MAQLADADLDRTETSYEPGGSLLLRSQHSWLLLDVAPNSPVALECASVLAHDGTVDEVLGALTRGGFAATPRFALVRLAVDERRAVARGGAVVYLMGAAPDHGLGAAGDVVGRPAGQRRRPRGTDQYRRDAAAAILASAGAGSQRGGCRAAAADLGATRGDRPAEARAEHVAGAADPAQDVAPAPRWPRSPKLRWTVRRTKATTTSLGFGRAQSSPRRPGGS